MEAVPKGSPVQTSPIWVGACTGLMQTDVRQINGYQHNETRRGRLDRRPCSQYTITDATALRWKVNHMVPEIVIVGTGPGPIKYLTREAENELCSADRVFFRMSGHPVCYWLKDQGKDILCFDLIYATPRFTYRDVYVFITSTLVKEAQLRGRAVYALPGNPSVFEATTSLLKRDAEAQGILTRVVPGLSFLELIYVELNVDPSMGLQILTPGHLDPSRSAYSEELGLLIGLVGIPRKPDPDCEETNVEQIMLWLLERFPPEHPVTLVLTPGMPDYDTLSKTLALRDLVQQWEGDQSFASLYVPPIGSSRQDDAFPRIKRDSQR